LAVRSNLHHRFRLPCATDRNSAEGVEAPFVHARLDRSQAERPALRRHLAHDAAASTASRAQRPWRSRYAPSEGRDGGVMKVIWG